jgi:hypothetical protein
MLFYTSNLSFLKSFFSFFKIYSNELRKYLVIHELVPKNETKQEEGITGEEVKAQMTDLDSLNNQVDGLKNSFNHKLSLIAHRNDQVSMISSLRG